MPMKRRLSKTRGGVVTPQIVAAYRHALKLRKRAHLSQADHDRAHEAVAIVERALSGGIWRLWLMSVFDVHHYNRPGDESWERAHTLRQQLDAGLAELKRQEREARRAGAPLSPSPAAL